jgi:hypothetical protein
MDTYGNQRASTGGFIGAMGSAQLVQWAVPTATPVNPQSPPNAPTESPLSRQLNELVQNVGEIEQALESFAVALNPISVRGPVGGGTDANAVQPQSPVVDSLAQSNRRLLSISIAIHTLRQQLQV